VEVLRAALSAIANAEAVDPAAVPHGATETTRRELSDDDVLAVLRREHDELTSAAADLRRLGRDDGDLQSQLAVLEPYLNQ
jgi:hypothetical protein